MWPLFTFDFYFYMENFIVPSGDFITCFSKPAFSRDNGFGSSTCNVICYTAPFIEVY